MRDRAFAAGSVRRGAGLLGPGLREPAYLSFVARLVGRLSRPVSQHPPPRLTLVRLQLGVFERQKHFSSACLKGKSKAKARQSKAGRGIVVGGVGG